MARSEARRARVKLSLAAGGKAAGDANRLIYL